MLWINGRTETHGDSFIQLSESILGTVSNRFSLLTVTEGYRLVVERRNPLTFSLCFRVCFADNF